MYKIYNNLAHTYLQKLFQMRDMNLDNTASHLRSVTHKNCHNQNAIYSKVVYHTQTLWFGTASPLT